MNGIAIVGLAGRFPGAADAAELWRNLRAGREAVTFFSRDELGGGGLDNPSYVPAAGVLDGPELFDAALFGMCPREAELTDPQHRLFLEQAWAALEDAGLCTDADSFAGRVGVWAGAGLPGYLLTNLAGLRGVTGSSEGFQALVGNDKDFLATRVSWKLNLRGPSVAVQSACSTSLVAVAMACQSLASGECDAALAGGVTLRLPVRGGYLYQEDGILSPDGHCRAFDAAARGTVPGSGVGVVVLKRLEDALAQGDRIRAVLRGWAVNNDGSRKMGYAAPGVEGQAEVIQEALALAGVSAESISYVEAHGTGTALGDPVEVAALTRAFRASTPRRGFCGLGSVKTNLGHLDGAAGVTGLIKVVLALEHGELPPSLHFERPNPELRLEESPFFVQDRLAEWPRNGEPRRAGVSSFGLGGTNAHVVVEEAPATIPGPASRRSWHLLALSAKTATALEEASVRLAGHLKEKAEADLQDVAWTLQTGRTALEHRRIVVCQEPADAVAALEEGEARFASKVQACGVAEAGHRPVAFLFPGHGAQRVHMGAELYRGEPAFRDGLDECAELLRGPLGLDIRDLLYPEGGATEEAEERLLATEHAQPALFAVEWALARLWAEWGVRPEAMMGHSAGELVAACLAGVFSLPDALGLVAERARLLASLPGGAMLAVPLGEEETVALLPPETSLAAVNAAEQCVVSGPPEVIDGLRRRLANRGLRSRILRTRHAFHSAAAEPIVAAFRARVAAAERRPPSLPFISDRTGDWITAGQALDPGYWAEHLRSPVRFQIGLETLLREPRRILVEVGPGGGLASLARKAVARCGGPDRVLSSLPHSRQEAEEAEETAAMLAALGRLWTAGAAVDWQGLHLHQKPRKAALPVYPFERRPFWVEPQAPVAVPAPKALETHKRSDPAEWLYTPSWRRSAPLRPVAASSRVHGRNWLVFADRRGLGGRVAERLLAGGAAGVVTVAPGEGFAARGSSSYVLAPERPAGYDELLAALARSGRFPDGIVHAWSLDADGDALSSSHLARARRLGLHSAVFLARSLARSLARALARFEPPSPVRWLAVTAGAREVIGGDASDPAGAAMLGLCRAVSREHPSIRVRGVDLPPLAPLAPLALNASLDRLADRLVVEIAAETGDTDAEAAVAYRGEHRWVERFEPMPLPACPDPEAGYRRHYLITGGLGHFGLTAAEILARRWRARLTLIDLRPREAAADRLRAIEQTGGEVLLLQGDVTDERGLAEMVERAVARFGEIHGVIHAAGLPASADSALGSAYWPVAETGTAEIEAHFAPKAGGLVALEVALAGQRPDFCLVPTSLAPLLGGVGLGAFGAADGFADAFVHRGLLPWRSVNFEAWLPGEGQAGLALTPAELSRVLERLLAADGLTRAVVSTADLEARLAAAGAPAEKPAKREERKERQEGTARPARDDVEMRIAALWEEVLGIDGVGMEDDFFLLGGNSLVGLQILSRIRRELEADLPLSSLFEARTVEGMARMVREGFREEAGKARRVERITEILDEIEGLTPEEIEMILAEEME